MQGIGSGFGVFVGACSLESVGAVVDPDGSLALDVLDGVTSLVGRSPPLYTTAAVALLHSRTSHTSIQG